MLLLLASLIIYYLYELAKKSVRYFFISLGIKLCYYIFFIFSYNKIIAPTGFLQATNWLWLTGFAIVDLLVKQKQAQNGFLFFSENGKIKKVKATDIHL